MVDAFSKGAQSAGAEIETVFLCEKNYKGCTGCFSCWFKTPGKCVFDDDMAEMLEKFKASDMVVFATPLYVDNVSGLMKNFMDRFMPLGDPHFEMDENGETRHVCNMKSPKIGVISNCGFPEQSHFVVLKLLFQRIARNFHSEVAFEIYCGGGAILSEAPGLLKLLIMKYTGLLKKAGAEVAENGRISDAVQAKLDKPMLPAGQYVAAGNKMFDSMLKGK
jgi:hypothetical protein